LVVCGREKGHRCRPHPKIQGRRLERGLEVAAEQPRVRLRRRRQVASFDVGHALAGKIRSRFCYTR
jgi:hypothetical protein